MQVVLGVTGGIAAYKAAEIVRGLRREGADVTVVMTGHALHFVTPLTLQTLSGRRVITSHFDLATAGAGGGDVEHVSLSRDCELLIVAPATANVIGKMAAGIADDFLTTFYLAVTCPVLLAPAMNTRMWEHAVVRDNVDRLRARGVSFVDPEEGPLASPGEGEGVGRLAPPEVIVARALALGTKGPLRGRRVLVTAGPTREPIDPVRYISSPSSGKMGFAIAGAARRLGAHVTLVTGLTSLPVPGGVEIVRVSTAEEMSRAVLEHLDRADIVVKAAAVSDFRPAATLPRKAKKADAPLRIDLERTPDILAEVGRRKGGRFVVGFAAETDDLVPHAREKLRAKNLDLIVANSVAGGGAFGADASAVTVLGADGFEQHWPVMAKVDLALRLMELIVERTG